MTKYTRLHPGEYGTALIYIYFALHDAWVWAFGLFLIQAGCFLIEGYIKEGK